MKNLIRGIAVLLTAVFLCFNIYYELAPGITVAPEQKFVFAAMFAVLFGVLRCSAACRTIRVAIRRRHDYMLAAVSGTTYGCWLNVLFFDNAFGRGFGHTSLDMVESGAAPHGEKLPVSLRLRQYLAAACGAQSGRQFDCVRADGRVPARTVPLAEKHFLLRGVARARASRRWRCCRCTPERARAMWMILSSISRVRCSFLSCAE